MNLITQKIKAEKASREADKASYKLLGIYVLIDDFMNKGHDKEMQGDLKGANAAYNYANKLVKRAEKLESNLKKKIFNVLDMIDSIKDNNYNNDGPQL